MPTPPKPLRPGDNCPSCDSLLIPHCTPWHWCGWVKCSRCKAFGTVLRWFSPTTEATEGSP